MKNRPAHAQSFFRRADHLPLLCNMILVLSPVSTLLKWSGIEMNGIFAMFSAASSYVITPTGPILIDLTIWSQTSKILGFVSEILALIPFLCAVVILKNLFHRYKQGDILSLHSVHNYKMASLLCFMQAFVIEPLSHMLMILAATLSNPVGSRYICISFQFINMQIAILGYALLVVGYAMEEALALKEEMGLTV